MTNQPDDSPLRPRFAKKRGVRAGVADRFILGVDQADLALFSPVNDTSRIVDNLQAKLL